ncbi:DUF2800 domain-containing protein [uncultured Megasphaera sp.]|uniref:DUF2800 domain-containing protein n=1 Tax=uncultured Megasphaera sp. TaxID=165188 RepID=UPI0025938024|nr:DUF2800 domain-containing protein [uncultured Megasphaera sp.]
MSEKKHALLSASGSARWLRCTASAEAEKNFPPEKESTYAAEGTVAHALAEAKLYADILGRDESDTIAELKGDPYYDSDMDRYTTGYAEYVAELLAEAIAEDPMAQLFPETRVDFSRYVPSGFGTADALILSDKRITVIDLKYGRGVPVSAKGNSQLALYALGAYDAYSFLYAPPMVRLVIYQPRIDHIEYGDIPLQTLIDWGTEYVAPRAKAAMEGSGKFDPGDHCRWCRARIRCRARAEKLKAIAKKDFCEPALLSDAELVEVLNFSDTLSKWAADVYGWAQAQAEKGKKIKGYKLVAGMRRRKIADEDGLLTALRRHKLKLDDIAPRKLATIGNLEKLIGKEKFKDWAADYIELPEARPILVPESDKREEIIVDLKNDF